MCVIPSVTLYAEISSHNGIAFGDKVIGRWLVHESNGIRMGLVPLKKRFPPPPPPAEGTARRQFPMKKWDLSRHGICQCIYLEFPASTTVGSKFLLFVRHSVYVFRYSRPNRLKHPKCHSMEVKTLSRSDVMSFSFCISYNTEKHTH